MRYKITATYMEQATDEFYVEADTPEAALNVAAGDDSQGEIIDVKNVWVGDRTYIDPPEVEEV